MPSVGTVERLNDALAGRYLVQRELGRGGMATVYLAQDQRHGRQVAVKVFVPEISSAVGPERFQREIDTVARLNHPHILALYDSGQADGLLYYVMPYVRGQSLRQALDVRKRLPIEEALRITRHVASALDHAHELGLVHRDIKPQNVMLHEGVAMLMDFGIARASGDAPGDALTQTGFVVGTPAYMSPEQGLGDPGLDGRSDIYSLACVLFEMLAGQPVFQGTSAVALVTQRLTEQAPSVRRLRADVPPAVDAALQKALARAAVDRFESAGDFVQALTSSGSVATPADRLVAVLPFLNLSADPDNEYFADGMTEDVIAQLSKVPALKVISRTSVMAFKKREHDLREIAARLGAGILLDGSVRRAGDRVRIVAQLIDARTDQHLWSETYDRQLTDIFAIQTDVAFHIAAALDAALTPEDRRRIRREPTANLEAYQLYLQGRHCFVRYTAEGMRKSIDYFQRAVERDPKYALAYVGIAFAHAELLTTGAEDPVVGYRQGREAAARALALDEGMAEAHCMMAQLMIQGEFDWVGAEAEFKRALELSPNSADTLDLYGRMCAALERYDEAIAMGRRAHELDPLAHRSDTATTLLRAGRYAEALDEARSAVEFDPHYDRGHATLAWALIMAGQRTEGVAELERAVELSAGNSVAWKAQLGQAYALVGRVDDARRILADLESTPAAGYRSPYHFAYIHVGLGDHERALDYLEQAFAQRSGAIATIKGSFLLTPLRTHPRFIALLRQMNLSA